MSRPLAFQHYGHTHHLNAVKEVLAEYPEIETNEMLGNDDLWYEAEVVYFSVNGERAVIIIPPQAGKSEIRPIVEEALATIRDPP